MKRQNKRKVFLLIGILFFAKFLLALLHNSEFVSSLENRTWDLRAILSSDFKSADKNIRIISIDQRSLDYYAKEENITWPWPRSLYVPVIEFLKIAKAKSVAFDILFTESSVHGINDDIDLARSMLEARKDLNIPVINAAVIENSKITLPVNEILESSSFGLVNARPDKDGIFRHTYFGLNHDNRLLLTLPFQVAKETNLLSSKFESLSSDNNFLTVNFKGPSYTYHDDNIVNIISSYVAITEGKKPIIDPKTYENSFVFVGVSAPGLLDLRPTSIESVYRGVEFNATILDNIIHSDFIKKPNHWWSYVLTLVFVALLSAFLLFSRNAFLQSSITLLLLSLFLLIAFVLAVQGYWILVAAPFITLTAAIILALGIQYQLEGKELKFIQLAFSHYVSPKIIDKIIQDPDQLSLGGERRELTIFFSDIQGFTSISEKMPPEKLVSLLNMYLTELTNIILSSGGTLDKYQGDAIIAFWNAPLIVNDHAVVGVKAALQCQEKLKHLETFFLEKFSVVPNTRIGMHTGEVTVGNFGSNSRFDYTIIGDSANLTSRLEGVNKVFGTSILISESTYIQCKDKIQARYIGKIKVIGKEQSIAVYEPYDSDFTLNDEDLSIFKNAVLLFEQKNLGQSLELFKKLPNDKVSVSYANRISLEKSQNMSVNMAWNPVWILDSK